MRRDREQWLEEARAGQIGSMSVTSHLQFQREHGIYWDVVLDGDVVTDRCVSANDMTGEVVLLDRNGSTPYINGFFTTTRTGTVRFVERAKWLAERDRA